MTIGERIKKIRKEKGLTQKSLGEKCGINEVQIRHYEIGKSTPKISTIEKIASGLGVSVTDLLYKESGNTPGELKETLLRQIEEITAEHPENSIPLIKKALMESQYITMKTIKELEAKELESKAEEKLILDQYNKLNHAGKQKAVEYTTDLAQMPKYQQDPDTKK